MEVFAETRFEVSDERSSLTYKWEGHGLRLQIPEGSTASFHIKVVWSNKFELPKGMELVSPVYWVSYEGKIGGQVVVELQHCARVREEGQSSGLSFAVCNVEKEGPPYWFELCKGQFSNQSSYGKQEVEFSSKFMAIVRWTGQPTSDPMFLAKIYYHQQQLSETTAHIVMVPRVDLTKVGVIVVCCINVLLY